MSALPRWHGRRLRCSYAISASTPTRPISSRSSPAASCTPTQHCGGHPQCSLRNTRGPSALWRHGISGDLPIVLVRIDESDDQGIVRQLLRAHEYWRMKQLAVDLVILNEQAPSYAQDLQGLLESQLRASQSRLQHDGHESSGRVFILKGDVISAEDRTLLQTAARAVLLSRRGTLAEQVERQQRSPTPALALPRRPPVKRGGSLAAAAGSCSSSMASAASAPDGHEYVTILGDGQWAPAPGLT